MKTKPSVLVAAMSAEIGFSVEQQIKILQWILRNDVVICSKEDLVDLLHTAPATTE